MKQHPEDLQTAGAHRGAGHVDYRETADVTLVHTPASREKSEPGFGTVPTPLWLIGVAFVAVFWAGAYLGMFSGGFSGDVYNELAGAPQFAKSSAGKPGEGGASSAPLSAADEGKKVFTSKCVSCHQATGLGIPGQYPPLAKSEYVTGGSKRLAMILLKGVTGPIKVSGTQFNGAMPGWQKDLTDKKIAAVLTYIRQEWGNKAPEIAAEQIAAARKEFTARTDSWTEAELAAVPADANLEGGAPAAAAAPPAEGAKK